MGTNEVELCLEQSMSAQITQWRQKRRLVGVTRELKMRNELDAVILPLTIATKEIERLIFQMKQQAPQTSLREEDRGMPIKNHEVGEQEMVSLAKKLLGDRRKREREFMGLADFADPQWDILLDLFVAKKIGKHISVSSACVAATVPATTALRNLSILAGAGLVERTHDQNDHRFVYVSLTEKAVTKMEAYLSWLAKRTE